MQKPPTTTTVRNYNPGPRPYTIPLKPSSHSTPTAQVSVRESTAGAQVLAVGAGVWESLGRAQCDRGLEPQAEASWLDMHLPLPTGPLAVCYSLLVSQFLLSLPHVWLAIISYSVPPMEVVHRSGCAGAATGTYCMHPSCIIHWLSSITP